MDFSSFSKKPLPSQSERRITRNDQFQFSGYYSQSLQCVISTFFFESAQRIFGSCQCINGFLQDSFSPLFDLGICLDPNLRLNGFCRFSYVFCIVSD